MTKITLSSIKTLNKLGIDWLAITEWIEAPLSRINMSHWRYYGDVNVVKWPLSPTFVQINIKRTALVQLWLLVVFDYEILKKIAIIAIKIKIPQRNSDFTKHYSNKKIFKRDKIIKIAIFMMLSQKTCLAVNENAGKVGTR